MTETRAPYKGLIPYSAEDAEFFFGRERERNFITANLLAERLTLLYGASGVGKSSVLRAGVEHHLRRLASENLKRLEKAKFVVVFFKDWNEDPLRRLLGKVQEAVERTLSPKTIAPVDSSLQFAEALFEWSERVEGQLLIILDQFEDYFLYHANEDGAGTFAEEFPRAVNTAGLPVNFLVSFREDAFAKLAFFKVRMPDVFGNYLPLEHLDRAAGRDAIKKPLEQYNKKYLNGKPPVEIEPALVEAVLKQVEAGQVPVGAGRGVLKTETTKAQIETPFLQMVMMRLWEEEQKVWNEAEKTHSRVLRLKTLTDLANPETEETGAQRIVRTHLDKKMGELSEAKQDIAADVFHYLVTPSGAKIAHTVPDLAEYAKLLEENLRPVLEDLAAGEMRILRGVSRFDSKEGDPRYEIFHDVLAEPILDWRDRRVRERELVEAARKAEEQRQAAQKQARDEEKVRSARRLKLLVAALLVMVVLLIGASIGIFISLRAAQAREIEANSERQEADRQKEIADEQKSEAQVQKTLAETRARELERATIIIQGKQTDAEREASRARASERIARANKTKAEDYNQASDRLSTEEAEVGVEYQLVLEVPPKEINQQCATLRSVKMKYERVSNNYVTLGKNPQTVKLQIAQIAKQMTDLHCP